MNINEIFLELNDDFSIKDQSQDPVTPYANGTVKIRVWSKTSGTEALLSGYKLANGNTVPETLLGLVQLNVDGNGTNEWAGFIQPSVLGAAAQDGARDFEARVVLIDLQNPTINAEAGFTIKEGTVSIPSDLFTTFPTPTLNTSYAVVLYESDGITPNGNIWQFRDTDLAGDPITETWIDSGLQEIKVYKNSVVADYQIEEGWQPDPEPVDTTATDQILTLLALALGKIGLIEQDAIDNPKVLEDFFSNYAVQTNLDNNDVFNLRRLSDNTNYRISLSSLREFLNKINKGTFDTAYPADGSPSPGTEDLFVIYPSGDPSPEDRTNWSSLVLSTNTQWDWDNDTFTWIDTGSLPPTAALDAQISISSVFTYLSNASVNQKEVNEDIDVKLKSFNDFRNTKGAANGLAPLDASQKVPRENLPDGIKVLKGTFGSALSTTGGDLPPTGNIAGDVYICDMTGYVSAEASLTFDLGDFALYDTNGDWVKIDNTEAVVSVNGKQGIVVLTVVDIANAEDDRNKITVWGVPTDVEYPSAKLVFDSLALKEDLANKAIVMPGIPDDIKYLSAKAVADYIALLKFTDLADTQDAATMLVSKGFNVKVSSDGLSLVFSRPDNNTSYGVLTGMQISRNAINTNNIDIAAGLYVEVDDSDPFFPITIPHEFSGLTDVVNTAITLSEVSYVSYHPISGPIFSIIEPDEEQRRNQAMLGVMSHFDKLNMNDIQSTPVIVQQPLHQTLDFHDKIALKSGVIFTGSLAATSFDKSSGKLKGYGLNADINQLSPNVRNVAAQVLEPFSPAYRDGGGGIAVDAPATVWDPTLYDDGTGVLATIGVPDSNATNIRIYVGGKGQTFIAYGQLVYGSITDAAAAVVAGQDPFTGIPSNILDNAVLRAIVSVRKGAVDFSLAADAIFYVPAASGGGGGGVGVVLDVDVAITSIFEHIAGATQKAINENVDKELWANRFIDLTYDTGGLFKATNSYPFVDTSKATFRFIGTVPSADLDLAAIISLDEGVTPYPLKLKDTLNPITVRELAGEFADVIRDGTDAIVNRTFPVRFPYSTGAVISSTKGLADLLDYGSPQITEILAVSGEQIVKDGDFPTTTNWSAGGGATIAVASGDLIITGNGVADQPTADQVTDSLIGTKSFFIKGKYRVTNAVATNMFIQLYDSVSGFITTLATIAAPNEDEWYPFSGIFTGTGQTGNLRILFRHQYADAAAANGKDMEIDFVEAIILTNKSYENDSLAELNTRFPSYIDFGFTDVADFELKSTGVQMFDKYASQNANVGSVDVKILDTGLRVSQLVSGGTRYVEYELNLIPNEDYIASTDRTIHTAATNAGLVQIADDAGSSLGQSTSSNVNFTVPSNGIILVRLYSNTTSGGGDVSFENLQLKQGTSAEEYRPYNSPTENFKIPNGISVGTSQDKLRFDVDRWLFDQFNDIDFNDKVKDANDWNVDLDRGNTVRCYEEFDGELDLPLALSTISISDIELIIGDTIYPSIGKSDLDANDIIGIALDTAINRLFIRIDKSNLTTSDNAGVMAYLAANDVGFRFKVANPIIGTEVDQDGSVIQEKWTTLIQQGVIGQDMSIDFAQNEDENNKSNSEKINRNKYDIDKLEIEVAALLVKIGDLTSLNTTDKSNLVNAINELVANIGDLTTLTTTEKSNLVGAINELVTSIAARELLSNKKIAYEVTPLDTQYPSLKLLQTVTGLLTALTTTTKTNLVAAINEVHNITKFITVTANINLNKVTLYDTLFDLPDVTGGTVNKTLSETVATFKRVTLEMIRQGSYTHSITIDVDSNGDINERYIDILRTKTVTDRVYFEISGDTMTIGGVHNRTITLGVDADIVDTDDATWDFVSLIGHKY